MTKNSISTNPNGIAAFTTSTRLIPVMPEVTNRLSPIGGSHADFHVHHHDGGRSEGCAPGPNSQRQEFEFLPTFGELARVIDTTACGVTQNNTAFLYLLLGAIKERVAEKCFRPL